MLRLAEFDLAKALEGWPVRYRNGEIPLEWHYFEKSNDGYPVISIDSTGAEETHTKGGFASTEMNKLDSDLMLILEDDEGWVYLPADTAGPGSDKYEYKPAEKSGRWCRPIQTKKEYGVKLLFKSKELRDDYFKFFTSNTHQDVKSFKKFKR